MRRRGTSSRLRAVAALFLLLALPAAMGAQDLAAWFGKPDNQAGYGNIAGETKALSEALRAASLSDSLIVARLEEGSRKHIAAALVLATLKEDTARFIAISAALRGLSLLPDDSRKASATVEQINLLLRAGIDGKTLDAALDAAKGKFANKAADAAIISRAVASLSVAATARAQYRLDDQDCLLIAVTLVDCDLSDNRLGSIIATLGAVLAKGGSIREALASVVEKTSGGKSEARDNGKGNQGRSDEGKGGSGKGKGGK
jgi:hypothetical protein